MSRARDFADLAGSADAGGLTGRNLIINGAMQVAQRATSATAVTNTFVTVDRFAFYESTDGAYTSEQSTTAPAGFSNSVKLAVTTADTSLGASQYSYFFHPIEGQNLQHLEYGLSSAKNVTLSFWVRSSKTGTYCITMEKHDNTRYHYTKEYAINSADTWEKKEITISPTAGSTSFITSSAGAMVSDNSLGARIDFWLAAGSSFTGGTDDAWSSDTNDYTTTNQVNWMDSTSNNFYLTGVQLEVGEQATPFEHRSYSDELARCQRYYFEIDFDAGEEPLGAYYNSSRSVCTQAFHVQMRADPTVTTTFGSGGLQSDYSNEHCFRWYGNAQQISVTSAKADAEL